MEISKGKLRELCLQLHIYLPELWTEEAIAHET